MKKSIFSHCLRRRGNRNHDALSLEQNLDAQRHAQEERIKMDRESIEKKVMECVGITYSRNAEDLSCDTRIKEDLGGQSILMVGLVSLMENELDVLIPLPEAAAAKTIGDIVEKAAAMLEE